MSKKMSLEEARRDKKLDRFCKEQLVKGDEGIFESILQAMVNGSAGGSRCTKDDDVC